MIKVWLICLVHFFLQEAWPMLQMTHTEISVQDCVWMGSDVKSLVLSHAQLNRHLLYTTELLLIPAQSMTANILSEFRKSTQTAYVRTYKLCLHLCWSPHITTHVLICKSAYFSMQLWMQTSLHVFLPLILWDQKVFGNHFAAKRFVQSNHSHTHTQTHTRKKCSIRVSAVKTSSRAVAFASKAH